MSNSINTQRLPPGITPSELRAAVSGRYDAVAVDPGAGYPFRVGREFAIALGYSTELLDTIPSCAVEAFTGVAAPMLQAQLSPGETVLDLGCGAGLDLVLAARAVAPGGRAIGVDMAPNMVERARRTVQGIEGAEVLCAPAEQLPLADQSVDCVVANGILNLAPDKSAILAEVARVLRPGGRFVLAEITLTESLAPDSIGGLEDWFR